MSIDPSSIPSFGAPQPAQPPIIRPDPQLVAQLLDQMGLKHGIDDEGDLGASWEGFRVYFMFRGEQKELFAVRAFYDRAYPLEGKGELLDIIDEWNRDTLWPKIYTHTHDEGILRLIGESQMITGTGVNLDYFAGTLANWIQAAIGFNGWLTERLGLQEDVGSVVGSEGSDSAEGDTDAEADGEAGAEADGDGASAADKA